MSLQATHPDTNAIATKRSLGVLSLATLLICSHYGLGFILGTAEQSVAAGAAGSLYAVSLGIGFLLLLVLVKFYWQSVDQIWTLLGHRYGSLVKVGIAFMSWVSLIGIAAVQMIAAAIILSLIGLPKVPTMVGVTVALCLLSLTRVERASTVFRGLLLLNIGALVYALWRLHSLSELEVVPLQFVPALHHLEWPHGLGVSIATALMVVVDMKCQQFIVRAKTPQIAYWGCVLAAIALLGLAFLPTAVVLAAQQQGIIPAALSGKEVLPYILAQVGGGTNHWQGILLMLSLAVPALGIGSNILRIQTKTILDLKVFPNSPYAWIAVTILNALCVLAIALRDREIINLILNFYTAYLSSIGVPFIAYLLAQANRDIFSANSVRLALLTGAIASVMSLGVTLVHPQSIQFGSSELTILLVGMGTSSLALLLTQLLSQVLTVLRRQVFHQEEVS